MPIKYPAYRHPAGKFIVAQSPAAVFIKHSKKLGSSVLAIFHELRQFLYRRRPFLYATHYNNVVRVPPAASTADGAELREKDREVTISK